MIEKNISERISKFLAKIVCSILLLTLYCGSTPVKNEALSIGAQAQAAPTSKTVQRQTLAVLPTTVIKPATQEEAAMLRDYLEEEISKQNLYKILDRAEVDKVLGEATLAQSGIVDSAAVKVGGFMGANYLLTSKLTIAGSKHVVTCRLIDVATSSVEKTATGRVSNAAKLDGAAKGCIRRLLGQM